MLKKSKGEKPEKPAKPEKQKGDKAKGGKPEYFWTAFMRKRQEAKSGRRESAIPKTPTSKEDKLKLIAAGVMVLLVPIVIYLIGVFGHHGDTAAK